MNTILSAALSSPEGALWKAAVEDELTSLVEHDILKISYRYQHVYVLTYISKISTGYL
jgi:hypothetical protein